MKAKIKLTVGIVIASFAVAVASISVNPVPPKEQPLYTEEDIEFLMNANQYSRKDAIEVLELASHAADFQLEKDAQP